MWLCEGKLKVKTAHFRLLSLSEKRLIKLPNIDHKRQVGRRLRKKIDGKKHEFILLSTHSLI